MPTRTWSSAIQGVDACTVEVEVNATMSGNDNVVTVVGLPDAAVRESRGRVWSTIYTNGFLPLLPWPPCLVYQNGRPEWPRLSLDKVSVLETPDCLLHRPSLGRRRCPSR